MPERPEALDENDTSGKRVDAADTNPVKQYYADKKKRYLREMQGAASDMKAGTPFDWEDAARYASGGADEGEPESPEDGK